MDQQGRMEKENKTVGTERCEKNNMLYINKYIKLCHSILWSWVES